MGDSKKDPRSEITTRIWGMAIAMIALSIPLVGIADDMAILPILVLLATTIGTVVIWRAPGHRRIDSTEMAELASAVRQLQQQIATMQIESHDQRLQRDIERLKVE